MSNAPPTQLAGYRAEVLDKEMREYSVWRCPEPLRCTAGRLDASCAGGTFGIMCAHCPMEPIWTHWDEDERRCVDCGESVAGAWIIALGLVFLALAMVLTYRAALPRDSAEQLTVAMEVAITLGLLLVLAQATAIFGRLVIPWPSPLRELLYFTRIFTLDLDFLQMDCATGLLYEGKYLVGALLPLLIIAAFGLVAALLPRLKKVKATDAPTRCVNAVGLGMQSLYIGLLLHGIKPFVFIQHPNGKKSVLDSPQVLVGTAIHTRLAFIWRRMEVIVGTR